MAPLNFFIMKLVMVLMVCFQMNRVSALVGRTCWTTCVSRRALQTSTTQLYSTVEVISPSPSTEWEHELAPPAPEVLRPITNESFDVEVLQAEGLVVAFFTSSWCTPCATMKRSMQVDVLPRHSAKAKFVEIDADQAPELAEAFSVRSIPSILMFQQGKVVVDIIGLVGANEISSQILKNF